MRARAADGSGRVAMVERPRVLVLDAYPREARRELRSAGATEAGPLYRRRLLALWPELHLDVGFPGDPDWSLPAGVALGDYDGIVWSGSSLAVHRADDPPVQRHLALARRAYEVGAASFGSCYAAQLAVVAAGGRCARNPSGREFGIARAITLSPAGRAHPLFRRRGPVFDAFASHEDEVAELPPGAVCLAGNRMSRVQAVDVRHGRGVFWALQYHPEYDLHELARLAELRSEKLLAEGLFPDAERLRVWLDDLESLHRDPARPDLAERLGAGPDVLDPAQRLAEVRCWLEHCLKPRLGRRVPR